MKNFYNYLGRYGKTQLWKFGETTNLNHRKSDIKREAKEKGIKNSNQFDFILTSQIATEKEESLFIESTIRKYLKKNGYKIIGNDHFKTNKKKNEVIADYNKGLNMAIAFLQIMNEE